jgi:U6 snRNA-associated Sm-like protein LSm1
LRSIDQFANLVLQDTIERIYVGNEYGDIERGIYLIRGENVVLLGEIDTMSEESEKLNEVSVDDILVAQREEHLRRQEQEKLRNKVLLDRGLQPETLFDDIYT